MADKATVNAINTMVALTDLGKKHKLFLTDDQKIHLMSGKPFQLNGLGNAMCLVTLCGVTRINGEQVFEIEDIKTGERHTTSYRSLHGVMNTFLFNK